MTSKYKQSTSYVLTWLLLQTKEILSFHETHILGFSSSKGQMWGLPLSNPCFSNHLYLCCNVYQITFLCFSPMPCLSPISNLEFYIVSKNDSRALYYFLAPWIYHVSKRQDVDAGFHDPAEPIWKLPCCSLEVDFWKMHILCTYVFRQNYFYDYTDILCSCLRLKFKSSPREI